MCFDIYGIFHTYIVHVKGRKQKRSRLTCYAAVQEPRTLTINIAVLPCYRNIKKNSNSYISRSENRYNWVDCCFVLHICCDKKEFLNWDIFMHLPNFWRHHHSTSHIRCFLSFFSPIHGCYPCLVNDPTLPWRSCSALDEFYSSLLSFSLSQFVLSVKTLFCWDWYL